MIVSLVLLSTAFGAKAPASLQEPIWVDMGALQPRVCVSLVPSAGRFRGKDAEGWEAVRSALEQGDLRAAVRLFEPLKDHPAKRSIRAAQYVAGDGIAINLDPIIEKYEDPCLMVLGAAVSLKMGDTPRVVHYADAAFKAWPDHPDVARLYAYGGSTPAERKRRLLEAAALHPTDIGLQRSAASLAEDEGDLSGAVTIYRRVLELGDDTVADHLFALALQTHDLDTYLRLALPKVSGLPGPDFEAAEDYGVALLDWLGLRSMTAPLYATLHTSKGDLRCSLDVGNAPLTVMNFVGLARGGQSWTLPSGETTTRPLYSGTIFHRVIPEFMIQGGDPEGTGKGGPGYRFIDEPSPNTGMRAGSLAMANSGRNTNGSQFFITEVATPHLSGKHTIFGHCDATTIAKVKEIARLPADSQNRPLEEVEIEAIEISTR